MNVETCTGRCAGSLAGVHTLDPVADARALERIELEAEHHFLMAALAIDRFGWLERDDAGADVAWRPLRSWSRSRAVRLR